MKGREGTRLGQRDEDPGHYGTDEVQRILPQKSSGDRVLPSDLNESSAVKSLLLLLCSWGGRAALHCTSDLSS